MSDSNKTEQFGQKREETKKNPKVFGLPVKIEPYAPVPQSGQKKRKDEKFDPFAVTYQGPKPEDF